MTEVVKVDFGMYLLNDGDSASTVARKVYGDVHKSVLILQANPGSWDDVERVKVPNKKGRLTVMQAGESPQDLIRRMFPEQPVSIFLQPFYIWNGGEYMRLQEGDSIFVPER